MRTSELTWDLHLPEDSPRLDGTIDGLGAQAGGWAVRSMAATSATALCVLLTVVAAVRGAAHLSGPRIGLLAATAAATVAVVAVRQRFERRYVAAIAAMHQVGQDGLTAHTREQLNSTLADTVLFGTDDEHVVREALLIGQHGVLLAALCPPPTPATRPGGLDHPLTREYERSVALIKTRRAELEEELPGIPVHALMCVPQMIAPAFDLHGITVCGPHHVDVELARLPDEPGLTLQQSYDVCAHFGFVLTNPHLHP